MKLLLIVLGVMLFVLWRLLTQKNKGSAKKVIQGRKKSNAAKVMSESAERDKVLLSQVDNPPSKNNSVTPQMLQHFLEFSLTDFNDLTEQEKKTVNQMSACFRKPHPLLLPLARGVFEPNELFELIKTDPQMTAKVLNAVNSPLFALRQSITSINHAIIFLGVSAVKTIAMQFAVENAMNLTQKSAEQDAAYKKLWTASYMASVLCFLLAKQLGKHNGAELSTQTLLCYLGDMTMLAYQPKLAKIYLGEHSFFERIESLQTTYGANTAIVGKVLAQQWQLPQAIVNGINNSLLPLTQRGASQGLSGEDLQNILLCYISCRFGDLISFQGVKDIHSISTPEAMAALEFYYLQEDIKRAGLEDIFDVLADSGFIKKANLLIGQVSR